MLPVADMPRVPGFATPGDLYCVTQAPAPLFGMPYPWRVDWRGLYGAGVRGVVCLASAHPDYDPSPVELIAAVELTDLIGGGPPPDPAAELTAIRAQVDVVVAHLERGRGVAVHCVGGRGRTGTVLGCVLVRLGHAPAEVVRYLDALHRTRGKSGWPEADWQAGVVEAEVTRER